MAILIAAIVVLHCGALACFIGNLFYLKHHDRVNTARVDWPRLTILIPARNEEQNLKRFIPTILEQDYPDLEVIIYDDGSEDGTASVIKSFDDARIVALSGTGPPAGWVGKVYALDQSASHATGDLYLFLDADGEFKRPDALKAFVSSYLAEPENTVFTSLTDLRGGGKLLVSLVPYAILTALPWPLVKNGPNSLGALNGQCWMIRADDYKLHQPHRANPDEILEDVMIGRYLKRQGLTPVLFNAQPYFSIHMYPSFAEAWAGFRKNAYLILGGRVDTFVIFVAFYVFMYIVSVFVSPYFLLSLVGLKLISDRHANFPLWVSILAPISFLASTAIQFDSAIAHWRGKVVWKKRIVSPPNTSQKAESSTYTQ